MKKKRDASLDTLTRFNPDITIGLTHDQVEERIEEGQVNKNNKNNRSILSIVLKNIFTPFNILYMIITLILIVLKSYANMLYLVTIIANFTIGLVQEIRAKILIDKLEIVSESHLNVIRDGEEVELDSQELVLDDIYELKAGQEIPTDSILVSGACEVNESLLTGESDSIKKHLGDKLFSGSFLVSGACLVRVDAVGKESYIQKLSAQAKKVNQPKSELLDTLNGIIKVMMVVLVISFIMTLWSNLGNYGKIAPAFQALFYYIFNGTSLDATVSTAFVKTMSALILLIPSGLFLTTSTALYVSVIRLNNKHNTYVQQLYCIEMLARVDTLCLDKTGTITDGSMRVSGDTWLVSGWDYNLREIIGSMMNSFNDTNMTSEALIRYYKKNSVLTPSAILPFNSARKLSAVSFENVGTYSIGAPEFVYPNMNQKIQAMIDKETLRGSRVLMLAYSSGMIQGEKLPRLFKPIALIYIEDQIRENASDVIKQFKANGVDVKVISGDSPKTVSSIAKRVGIANAENYISLQGLSDDDIKECALDYTVFGRVSPEQKKLLVEIFQSRGRKVAMTGDGVNDIPALKQADCSIAMAAGCQATRQVSQLVLKTSDFNSLPAVVNEGRQVINNIQNTSTLFLNKTLLATLLIFFYFIIGFTPLHIAYPYESKCFNMLEMFLIGGPSFIIALKPNHQRIKGKFLLNVIRKIVPSALTVLMCNLALCLIYHFGWFAGNDILVVDPSLGANGVSIFVTIGTFANTFVCLLVLGNICMPYESIWEKLCITVFPLVCGLCVLAGYVWPWFRTNFIAYADLTTNGTNFMPLITVFFLMAMSYPVNKFFVWILKPKNLRKFKDPNEDE